MKFIVWLGCVSIALDGLEQALFMRDGWRWFWIALLIFWFLSGCVLVLVGLAKIVAGKSGAWLTRVGGGSKQPAHVPEIPKGSGQ